MAPETEAPIEFPHHQGMRLRAWQPLRSGQVRGLATVELPIGLEISGIMVVAGKDGLWARLPQRPRVRDGRQLRGGDGQPLYEAVIAWSSRHLADAFSRKVIELVRERAPRDLDEGVAGNDV